MARPTTSTGWATNANFAAGVNVWNGQPNKAAPGAGVEGEGFDPQAGMPAEWLNYKLNSFGQWIDWIMHPPVLGTNTPQTQWTDESNNVRHLVDHNGYPMGRRNEFREQWAAPIVEVAAGAKNNAPFSPIWAVDTTANAQLTTLSGELNFIPGTANTNHATAGTNQTLWTPSSFLVVVLEYEFQVSLAGANLITWFHGLTDTLDPAGTTNNIVRFDKRSADTNWQVITGSGAAITRTDTGVPPVANTYQSFKLEYHGTATAYGVAAIEGVGANTAKARFFIDGTRVITQGLTMPTAAMALGFGGKCTGAAASTGKMSALLASWNRFLSAPAL